MSFSTGSGRCRKPLQEIKFQNDFSSESSKPEGRRKPERQLNCYVYIEEDPSTMDIKKRELS